MNGLYFSNTSFPREKEDKQELVLNKENWIFNILNNNLNKRIKINGFFNNENIIFEGILANLNENFLVVNDPVNDKWFILSPSNINYVEFEEEPEI